MTVARHTTQNCAHSSGGKFTSILPLLVIYGSILKTIACNGWFYFDRLRLQVTHPGNLAVSKQGEVLVADRGTQQFKLYQSSGTLLKTYGQEGGYSAAGATPGVSSQKFWFFPASVPGENGGSGGAPLAFTNDEAGTFWVGDPGNKRLLHLARDGTEIEEVMFIPRSYKAATDWANTSRIFCNFLEFSCDLTKPIAESWTLVRNWAAGLGPAYTPADFGVGMDLWPSAGFTEVVTVNGRTLAMLPEVFPHWPYLLQGI